ncbi:hypothetical protein D3C78_1076010 [compost metagenome]
MRQEEGLLGGVIAQEHQIVWFRLFGAVTVPLCVKLLECCGVVDAFLDHEAAHHAAGFFRVETDDLVLAVLQVLELGVDDPGVQGAAFDRREILVGGQVQ